MATVQLDCVSQSLWEDADALRHRLETMGMSAAACVDQAALLISELCMLADPAASAAILTAAWRRLHDAEWLVAQLSIDDHTYRPPLDAVAVLKTRVLETIHAIEEDHP